MKQTVHNLLARDSISRKLKQWPLYNSNKIKEFQEYNDNISALKTCDDIYVVKPKYHNHKTPKICTDDICMVLDRYYPGSTLLLKQFSGNLAICGGSLFRILNKGKFHNSDVDFFFININEDEATKVLIDAVTTLVHYLNRKKNVLCNSKDPYVYLTRNQYVTTLHVTEPNRDIDTHMRKYKYQFIHRIYPSIDQIIGGFDLGPCMVAFVSKGNDFELYATELGAWSIINKALIVDTTRRSTSFESRIYKYSKQECLVILPGVNPQNLLSLFSDDYAEKVSLLQNTLKQMGFEANNILSKSVKAMIKEPFNKIVVNYLSIVHRRSNNYDLNIESHHIQKLSDYDDSSCWSSFLPKNNNTKLRTLDLEFVSSITILHDNVALDNLRSMIESNLKYPNVYLNIGLYNEQVQNLINGLNGSYTNWNGIGSILEVGRTKLIRLFAERANEVYYLLSGDETHLPIEERKHLQKLVTKIIEIRNFMIDRMQANAIKAHKELQGIKWITQNPGRQWTSSINPIITDPRDWYGKSYVSFRTGIPVNVETILRLLIKRKSVFTIINKDMFNIILLKLAKTLCNY